MSGAGFLRGSVQRHVPAGFTADDVTGHRTDWSESWEITAPDGWVLAIGSALDDWGHPASGWSWTAYGSREEMRHHEDAWSGGCTYLARRELIEVLRHFVAAHGEA